jgi:hypothetical protein
MTQEQLRMQMLAGIITESEYKSHINNPISEGSPVKDTINHEISDLEIKLYDDGVIEICNPTTGKRINAYKYQSPSSGPRGFEKIKDYLEKFPSKKITSSDIFNSSGMQYAGTVLKILNFSSDKCGEEGLKTISWSR